MRALLLCLLMIPLTIGCSDSGDDKIDQADDVGFGGTFGVLLAARRRTGACTWWGSWPRGR